MEPKTIDTGFLFLVDDSDGSRVFFSKDECPVSLLDTFTNNNYRTSPIFSLYPEHAHTPDLSAECYIGFFYCSDAFFRLGGISADLDVVKEQGRIWFSFGLASIIVISEDIGLIEKVKSVINGDACGRELWKVINHKIFLEEVVKPEPKNIDNATYAIQYSKIVDPSCVEMLNDLSHEINKLTAMSARYAPQHLSYIASIVRTTNRIINNVSFWFDLYHDRDVSTYKEIGLINSDEIRSNKMYIQERINLHLGNIHQITASLPYYYSQCFAGAVPIAENQAPFGSNSLLGIGVAYIALANLTLFIEETLHNYPITQYIRENMKDMPGFLNCVDQTRHDPALWTHDQRTFQSLMAGQAKEPLKSCLIYYSSRHGFKENEHTVTAAWEAIRRGDSAEWNLLTMSHELVHSHVRMLLGAIFQGDDHVSSEENFKNIFNDYDNLVRSQNNTNGHNTPSLLQSIRCIIFTYCVYRKQYAYLFTKTPDANNLTTGYVGCKDASEMLKIFKAYYNDINEIIVHVLDYHYFYDCQSDIYVGLIWKSWSTVPVVLETVDVYLLRTLLAVGSRIPGNPETRFDCALETVSKTLMSINQESPNETIKQALDLIVRTKDKNNLQNRFDISIQLADMVKRWLCFDNIYSSLIGDPDKFGDLFYDLKTGVFRNQPIKSPVAFLLDRGRLALGNQNSQFSLAYRSAWLLSACASVKPPEN